MSRPRRVGPAHSGLASRDGPPSATATGTSEVYGEKRGLREAVCCNGTSGARVLSKTIQASSSRQREHGETRPRGALRVWRNATEGSSLKRNGLKACKGIHVEEPFFDLRQAFTLREDHPVDSSPENARGVTGGNIVGVCRHCAPRTILATFFWQDSKCAHCYYRAAGAVGTGDEQRCQRRGNALTTQAPFC